MVIYTRRFGSAVFAGTRETQLLATVPSGVAWVVRDIVVANPTTAEADVQVWISNPGALHLFLGKVPVGGFQHLELRQRMYTNEQLMAYASVPAVNLVVTGYELTIP